MLSKLLFAQVILTTMLFAKVDVIVQQIKNGDTYVLNDNDIIFSEDYIRLECSSDIGEKFTLTYQYDEKNERILYSNFLNKNKTHHIPSSKKALKLDTNTGIIVFKIKDSSGVREFQLNHISNNIDKRKIFDTSKNHLEIFQSLDKKKYLDYSTAQTSSRGEKEKIIWKALQNATVIVKASNGDKNSMGAGTIIKDGKYILTNYHVVEPNVNDIYIAFKPKLGNNPSKNNFYKVDVVKYDMLKDLALLKLDNSITNSQTISALKIADKSSLEVGEDIYNMGHPIGYFYTPGRGMIKNISNDFSWGTHAASYVIQHSIPSSSGSSGGPVVNDKLELVGIGAFTNTKGQNLNFVISSIDIKEFIKSPKNETKQNNKLEIETSLNLLDKYIIKKGSIKEVTHGYIKAAKLDINKNGIIDALLFDKNNDGKWDLVKYDKNEDGIIEKVTNY